MWTQEMFGVEKPIIALLHLDALPGDPGYCGSMDTVLEHARQDLVALQNGGVDVWWSCSRATACGRAVICIRFYTKNAG